MGDRQQRSPRVDPAPRRRLIRADVVCHIPAHRSVVSRSGSTCNAAVGCARARGACGGRLRLRRRLGVLRASAAVGGGVRRIGAVAGAVRRSSTLRGTVRCGSGSDVPTAVGAGLGGERLGGDGSGTISGPVRRLPLGPHRIRSIRRAAAASGCGDRRAGVVVRRGADRVRSSRSAASLGAASHSVNPTGRCCLWLR